jgi:hypothetical protein
VDRCTRFSSYVTLSSWLRSTRKANKREYASTERAKRLGVVGSLTRQILLNPILEAGNVAGSVHDRLMG